MDLLPGPSEALAIADKSARADYLAADLLAQAEHGSGRERIYFVHSSQRQAAEVEKEILRLLPRLKHGKTVRKILKSRTCFIEVPDLEFA